MDDDLDEVVVVGNGTEKKQNMTCAVDYISVKVLASRPIANVLQGLQGLSSGLISLLETVHLRICPMFKMEFYKGIEHAEKFKIVFGPNDIRGEGGTGIQMILNPNLKQVFGWK